MAIYSQHAIKRHAGFSMIEVLVTLLIVTVGLLGLGALMLKGLKANSSSQLRTVAVSQAYDIADRMRANVGALPPNTDYYSAVLPDGSESTCSTKGLGTTVHVQPATSASTCSTCTNACSVKDVAARDACEWNVSNASLLPLGAGAVCKDAANRWYTVYVSWDDERSGQTSKTFSMRFEP